MFLSLSWWSILSLLGLERGWAIVGWRRAILGWRWAKLGWHGLSMHKKSDWQTWDTVVRYAPVDGKAGT